MSRTFCTFLCGPDAFSNCELNQIEAIFQIDLSIFRNLPVNLEPQTDRLEYLLYEAKEQKDLEAIQQIKNKIEQEKIDWKKNYHTINEGWTKVSDLLETVEELIKKLIKQPDYHQQLEYNFNWGNYFHPERPAYFKKVHPAIRKSRESTRYIDNILLEDLQTVLDWLKGAKELDIEYMTFDYG